MGKLMAADAYRANHRELRSAAEEKVAGQADEVDRNGDALRLLYELRVHQVELEMQNDELREEHSKLRLAASVFQACLEGIVVLDAKQIVVDLNDAFLAMTGFSRVDIVDQLIGEAPLFGENAPGCSFGIWRSVKEQGFWRGEVVTRHKNGVEFSVQLAISSVDDEWGQVKNYICTATDISQIKNHEAELEQIANYDPLTGVPNRRLLADRLAQAIARANRSGLPLAVCYFDLDGFKAVNDQYGHAVGDQLLIEITRRLLGVLRAEDTLARLGGDEFVLLLANLPIESECSVMMERVFSVIQQEMQINQHCLAITASIGVAMYPQDDVNADTLLRHADHAMYAAKQAGKNRFHLYDVEQEKRVQSHRKQLQYLSEALTQNEFVMFYQPKVDLLSGLVCGAEALLRWQHPLQGLLLPKSFLHDVDGSDLEVALGEWTIQNVLAQMAIWADLGLYLVISLNISAKHLLEPHFAERLAEILNRFPQLKPHYLELEILETAALNDMEHAIATILACKRLGVRFALDDFGTGYSSLSYFRKLPIDVLKIDQSFVLDMLSEHSDSHLIEGILRLAAAFNRPVVAEGVESAEHGAALLKLGCHVCQGFGIARPMPAQMLPDWVIGWEKNKPWQDMVDAMRGDTLF